jgi:hypothetical protein
MEPEKKPELNLETLIFSLNLDKRLRQIMEHPVKNEKLKIMILSDKTFFSIYIIIYYLIVV